MKYLIKNCSCSNSLFSKSSKVFILKVFFVLFLTVLLLTPTTLHAVENSTAKHPSGAELETIFQNFEQYAEKNMRESEIPGMSIAIFKDDKIIYSKAFGVKTQGKIEPVTINTLFQVGSTSKAFTAAMVAMLVDEGKLDWNDRLIDHLPDFKMYDPWVTREFKVKDLMAQRSGMPGYSGDMQVFLGYDRDHLFNSIQYIKPVSSFRSEFAYQNNLFLAAGKLIEAKTGKTWEENLQTRILEPLRMKNTTSDLKSYQNAADVATLHRQLNEKTVPIPMDWILMDWVYVYGPAGGINSNVLDMAKWIQLHMNNGKLGDKQLVSKENMEFMHSPKTIIGKTESSPLQHYCIAWVYREYHPNPIIWHTGGTSGCTTMAAFIPNENIGIIILTNSVNKLPEKLAYYFFDRYFDRPVIDWYAIFLEQEKEKQEELKIEEPAAPKKPIPPLPLEIYAGEYENNIFGKIKASVEKGHLILTAGPKEIRIKLTHFDGNIFQAENDDLGGNCGFAYFEVNVQREAEVLMMDLFGGNTNPLIRVQKNDTDNKSKP